MTVESLKPFRNKINLLATMVEMKRISSTAKLTIFYELVRSSNGIEDRKWVPKYLTDQYCRTKLKDYIICNLIFNFFFYTHTREFNLETNRD